MDTQEKLYREVEYVLRESFLKEAVQNESSDFYGMEIPSEIDRETLTPIVERFQNKTSEMIEGMDGVEPTDLLEAHEDAIFIGLLESLGRELNPEKTKTAVHYKEDADLKKAFTEAMYELAWDWETQSKKDELDEARAEVKKLAEGAYGVDEIEDDLIDFIQKNQSRPLSVAAAFLDAIEFALEDAPEYERNTWIDRFLKFFVSRT